MKDFNRWVGLFEDEVLTLEGFRDLDGSEKRFFKSFIAFCRRSRGFHQC